MTREEAVKWLDNLTQDIGQMRHQDLWDYAQALSFISQMIDEMPSADVVEVMRCKDCKYYKESKYFAHEKACYRYKDNEGNKIGYIKSDNDFCSYGERKETK